MFFRTAAECQSEAESYGFDCDPAQDRIAYRTPFPNGTTLSFSRALDRSYALARQIVGWCGPFERMMFWVTEWGIWPSSENLHLYYTVRRAAGDGRELRDAPGHVFLGHERAELTTHLDLAIRFGWGGFLFGYPQDVALTISHDEWIRITTTKPLAPILKDAEDFGLKVLDRNDGNLH
jgi:hypothetical protein